MARQRVPDYPAPSGVEPSADGPGDGQPSPADPDAPAPVEGQPGPSATVTSPPPTPVELTVSVSRTVWTDNPRGSWEARATMRATPAPGSSSVVNLNRMHALLTARVQSWMEGI